MDDETYNQGIIAIQSNEDPTLRKDFTFNTTGLFTSTLDRVISSADNDVPHGT